MNIEYTKAELSMKHYLWSSDRREDADAYDLDTMPLDILQGYEVLIFANTFLNLYLPHHTIKDLHHLEHALIEHLPHYVKAKRDVAAWLGKHLYFVRSGKTADIYTRI